MRNSVITIDITALIGSLVDNLKSTNSITSITDNGNGIYTFKTPDTGYLVDYDYITISDTTSYNNDMTIVYNVVPNTSFDISLSTGKPDETGTWTKNVNFYHGTPQEVYNQLTDKISNVNDKRPIVVLYEPYNRNLQGRMSVNYAEPSLWMAFMTTYENNWTHEEHHTKAIAPMSALLDNFLLECRTSNRINKAGLVFPNAMQHAKYGLLSRFNGHKKQLLEDVSGVEINDWILPVKKQYNCIT